MGNRISSGRKLWDGKDEQAILHKLEEAFSYDCTDEEACFYADISTSTLYNYQKKNPAFLERKQALKSRVILLARKTVVNNLTKDPNFALRYLERKRSKEFSLRYVSEVKQQSEFDELSDEQLEKIIGVRYSSKKQEVTRSL
jgi:hypothetical protein